MAIPAHRTATAAAPRAASGPSGAGSRGAFVTPLRALVRIEPDPAALAALSWKELGPGLRMATVAKDGAARLVVYRIAGDAPPDAFARHRHPGGEVYIMLQGHLADEMGRYGPGDLVYLPPGSVHTPRAEGETLILVLWPTAVEVLGEGE